MNLQRKNFTTVSQVRLCLYPCNQCHRKARTQRNHEDSGETCYMLVIRTPTPMSCWESLDVGKK